MVNAKKHFSGEPERLTLGFYCMFPIDSGAHKVFIAQGMIDTQRIITFFKRWI